MSEEKAQIFIECSQSVLLKPSSRGFVHCKVNDGGVIIELQGNRLAFTYEEYLGVTQAIDGLIKKHLEITNRGRW